MNPFGTSYRGYFSPEPLNLGYTYFFNYSKNQPPVTISVVKATVDATPEKPMEK